MDLSDLLFESEIPFVIPEIMRQKLIKMGYTEEQIDNITPDEFYNRILPKISDVKHTAEKKDPKVEIPSGFDFAKKEQELINSIGSEHEFEFEEPEKAEEPRSIKDVVDDAQGTDEEQEESGEMDYSIYDDPMPNEPRLEVDFRSEEGTWDHDFEEKVLSARTVDNYISLFKEKHNRAYDEFDSYLHNQEIDEANIKNSLMKFNTYGGKVSRSIQDTYIDLEKARRVRSLILSREDAYDIKTYEHGNMEAYEERLEDALRDVDTKIITAKRDLYNTIIDYPTKASGFSIPIVKKRKNAEKEKSAADSYRRSDKLDNAYNKAIESAGTFYGDTEEYDQFIEELDQDYKDYSTKIADLVEQAVGSQKAYGKSRDQKDQDEWLKASKAATTLLSEFKKKYDVKAEKPLKDKDFRDQRWYSIKFNDYMTSAATLPGAPASIKESLDNLTKRNKFSTSASKYPDIGQVIDDRSLIEQVVRGVRPLAHTKMHRKEIKLSREESKRIAFVLAPAQMGGGVIWYRPSQTAGERAYDERILGLDPEADKEDRPTTKPYNPMANDQNLNIVELYIWNNISNRSDPRLYNFINGLCLGYPRDYVIWFCESQYGQTDHRQPNRTFWGRMLDRFRYCINAGVNGYGRPGSIKPDGMFSTVFKYMTPNFVSGWINKILGTSEELYDPQKGFETAVGEFQPVRAPEKTEFEESRLNGDDPIIESLYSKLDNL